MSKNMKRLNQLNRIVFLSINIYRFINMFQTIFFVFIIIIFFLLQFSKHIEDGLKEAREKHLKCEILIPCGLTMRIARDILIMSESEPCGIRGCSLIIHLQEKSKCCELVKLQYDPTTVSTFEIHLTLQEDTRQIVSVRKMMMQLTGCFKHSTYKSTPKMLCLAYKLEKQKLYRATC